MSTSVLRVISPVRRALSWMPPALLILSAVVVANATLGASPVPIAAVLASLAAPLGLGSAPEAGQDAILWAIRFPRIGIAVLVGAALSVGGALMQGVFRNPLADPAVLGVSGGAAVGAAAVQVWGGSGLVEMMPEVLRPVMMAVGAFVGALGASAAVERLGERDGVTTGDSLLLGGIAVNAGSSALLAVLLWVADDAALRGITMWMLGSLGGATGALFVGILPLIAVPIMAALAMHRSLDALLLGETEAMHLGVEARKVRRQALVLTALMVGAAVAVSGAIGFVGLVVPQAVRLAAGATHGVVLVGSLLAGPTLLLIADLGARTLVSPAEMPIGVLTSLVGAPVFVWLLRRNLR